MTPAESWTLVSTLLLASFTAAGLITANLRETRRQGIAEAKRRHPSGRGR